MAQFSRVLENSDLHPFCEQIEVAMKNKQNLVIKIKKRETTLELVSLETSTD